MPDFIPRPDEDLAAFASSFARRLDADPVAFGVTADQAAECTAAAEAFGQAHRAAVAGTTRGVLSIAWKKQKRAELVHVLRGVSKCVRAHPGTSDAMLVTLGLKPRRSSYAKNTLKVPDAAPVITIQNVEGSAFTVRVSPGDGSEGWSMPRGAVAIMIMMAVGETCPEDRKSWRPAAQLSRARATLTLGATVQPGERVWLRASYVGTNQRTGPFGEPVQRRIGDQTMKLAGKAEWVGFAMRKVA